MHARLVFAVMVLSSVCPAVVAGQETGIGVSVQGAIGSHCFGARVLLTEHLSAFADLRFMFQSRRGEPDAGGFGPVRSGLAWRF